MSAVTVTEEVRSLRELVADLIREHRIFPQQIHQIKQDLLDSTKLQEVAHRFVSLQSSLMGHMVTEEFDFYPVLAERGLFDETVSAIMQQHHEISADLTVMEVSLRARDLREFKLALDELEHILKVHQPAEEENVFPRVA
jgi:hemerythrin superfamily protein